MSVPGGTAVAHRLEPGFHGKDTGSKPTDAPRGSSGSHDEQIWELVRRHEASVAWLAREYRHLGIPFEDLKGEGILGLIEAAGRFDPKRGVRFITYGLWWARKRIGEIAMRQASLVRVPRYRLRRLTRVRAAEHDIAAAIGRPPTTEEIAREAGMPVRDVETLLGYCRREVSLQERVGSMATLLLEETIAGCPDAAPDAGLFREDRESLLWKLLSELPDRQQRILVWRFGLDGHSRKTLAEVGEILDLSRERVRQMQSRAIASLRRLAREADQVGGSRRDSPAERGVPRSIGDPFRNRIL